MEPQPDSDGGDELTAFEETLTDTELEEYRRIRDARESDPTNSFDPAEFNAEMAGKFGHPFVGEKEEERERYNHGAMP